MASITIRPRLRRPHPGFRCHGGRRLWRNRHVTAEVGRPIDAFDAMIAAIASSRAATIATRTVADFAGCGVPIVDPWTD